MELGDILVVALAYFVAALVKGTTGLGYSTTALPILVLALGLKTSLPLVIIPSLASNMIVLRDAGHVRETVARFWPLYLAAVPGIAFGLWLLSALDGPVAAGVLGLVLTAMSLHAFARPDLTLPEPLARALAVPAGFLTGVVNGLTGSQVMPIVPYVMAMRLAPARFVTAINLSFTLSGLVMAAGLATVGLMTPAAALVSLGGLVLVFAGVRLGTGLRRRLSPAAFRRAVLVVLLTLGLTLIIRAIVGV